MRKYKNGLMENHQELSLYKIKSLILSHQNKLPFVLLGLGILLVIIGLLIGKVINISSDKVEALQTPGVESMSTSRSVDTILVDVSGEVINPGVYKLPTDARTEDALIASGGLSSNADRNYVSKFLNKAAKLIDGQKIFIPSIQQSNTTSATTIDQKTNVAQSNIEPDNGLVNINTSSSEALDTLPGIGQTYAQKIVDNRPYSHTEELVSKKVLGQSLYNKIKDKITIY